MFEWMAWTMPVAIFFTCIVLMLIGMTVWEIKSPTVQRKGWLPIATTRGDRLFIGLVIAWFGLEQEPSIWVSFVLSMLLLGLILRKG
jgi:predicted small integral membrane protein